MLPNSRMADGFGSGSDLNGLCYKVIDQDACNSIGLSYYPSYYPLYIHSLCDNDNIDTPTGQSQGFFCFVLFCFVFCFVFFVVVVFYRRGFFSIALAVLELTL